MHHDISQQCRFLQSSAGLPAPLPARGTQRKSLKCQRNTEKEPQMAEKHRERASNGRETQRGSLKWQRNTEIEPQMPEKHRDRASNAREAQRESLKCQRNTEIEPQMPEKHRERASNARETHIEPQMPGRYFTHLNHCLLIQCNLSFRLGR